MGHQPASSSSNVIVPFEFSSEMDPLPGVERPLSNVSNFLILSGRPGSGKTTALLNLLLRKQHLAGKYDTVFVVSPSLGSFAPELLSGLPDDQKYESLDSGTLDEIANKIKHNHQSQKVLVVFDDVVNDLNRSGTQRSLQKLLFNRRHLTSLDPNGKKGGFVSVIATTQVLNR